MRHARTVRGRFSPSGSSKLPMANVCVPHDEGPDTGSLVVEVAAISLTWCLAVSVVLLAKSVRGL